MSGSNRSNVTVREALLHFAAESNLELHEAGSELDHLLARSCASQLNFNQTALRTYHRQQSFTVAHHPPRLPMKSPAYSYPSAFYILTPLLNADTQPAFNQMLCEAYDTYADFISLSIQEQRGLLYIEAITPQDAVDSLDELLVRLVHASQDRYLRRADDRANKGTKPPTAPQSICSAVRLFKSLQKFNRTIIKSTTPSLSPEECTRQRYQRLWSDEDAPANLSTPEAAEPIKVHDRGTLCKFIREYSSSKSAGGDGIHGVIMKNLLGSAFTDHLSGLYDLISEYGCTPTR